MKERKRVVLGVLATVLLVTMSVVAACAPAASEKAGKTVKVGMMWDMTGAVSMGAQEYTQTLLSYARLYNEEKGGIQGRNLEVLWSDTGYQVPRAISAYNRFKEQGVVAMQIQASQEAVAMRPMAERDRIPLQTSGSVPEALYPPAWVYASENTPFSDQFAAYFSWIKQGWKEARPPRIAIIGFDNAMGRAPQRAEKLWKEMGIDVVVQEYVSPVSLDFSTQLVKVKEAKADYLWLTVAVAQTSVIVRQARTAGIPETTQIAAGGYNAPEEMPKLAGPFSEGFVQVLPVRMLHETEVAGVRQLRDTVNKYYGAPATTITAAYGWIDMMLLAEAINGAAKEVGVDKLNGSAVKASFDKLTNLDTGGLTPPLSYGPEKRRGNDSVRMYQIKGGKYVPISDWIAAPIIK